MAWDGWPRLWKVAGFLWVLMTCGAGCGDTCSGVYHCPAAVTGEIDLPASAAGRLVSVTTVAPCKTSFSARGWAEPLSIYVDGPIPVGTTRVCEVHGTLSDGTELEASISFRSVGACCSSLSTAVDSPATFSDVDGGSVDAPPG